MCARTLRVALFDACGLALLLSEQELDHLEERAEHDINKSTLQQLKY